MRDVKLEVGLSPPIEKEAAEERTDMILGLIKNKGVAYPAEIGGELNIPKDTTYRLLRFLEAQGKIERLSLDGNRFVPDWLDARLHNLWKRGIKGDAIRRISWYRVVGTDGISKSGSAESK